MSEHPLPAAVSALFPPAAERARIEGWLTQALLEALARVRSGPVIPNTDMARFAEELASLSFDTPQPIEQLLEWTLARMEHGIVQMSNPRYFGLFNPAASFPAQCADRVVSAFNPQLASSASSPVPVALEAHVIRVVAQRAGFQAQAGGHFATGGSEANYTALLCALTAASPRFAQEGARAFAGPPVFYTSRDCHIAWLKIAHQAGVGRGALRLVATDGTGRMDPRALEQAILADRSSGAVPVMIVATAGTTGGGMIDPLQACANIARREGLWYHVDAAWGGPRSHPTGCAACSPASSAPTRSPSMPISGLQPPWDAPCTSPRAQRSCRRSFTPPPASCPRATPRSIPTSTASSGRGASSVCGCFCRWARRAGRALGLTSSAASR